MVDAHTSRMPFVADREALPESQRHNYDRIADSRGGIPGPFGVLLNSPEIGGRIGHLGAYVRFEGELADDDRELAILTTAREFDCAFEWAAHVPIARDAGVGEAAIDAVADRGGVDDLAERERLIVRYARHLLGEHAVPDELFERARETFGVSGITELTATIGYYGMIACVLNAFEVLPEGEVAELP